MNPRFPLLVCAAAATLLGLWQVQAADGGNLVRNPSLETAVAEGALPEGWHSFQNPETGYQMRVVSPGRTGERSLQISGEGQWGGVAVHRVPLAAGKAYAARGWAKLAGAPEATAVVKLDYFNEAGEWMASSPIDLKIGPGPEWKLISLVSRPEHAPGAKQVGLAVAITGKGQGWFDDLELLERDSPETPLLRNGDMEVIAGDAPAGYASVVSEGGKVRLGWTDRKPKSGWYAFHLKGNSEWAVVSEGKRPIEKGKRYILTGYARAASGTAQIKIDYFKDNEYLGHTVSEDATGGEWQMLKAISELEQYPQATHFAPSLVGLGDMDCDFDALELKVR